MIIQAETAEQFFTELNDTENVVMVDFYADWCQPCKQLMKFFPQLDDELKGIVKVVKVNIEQLPDIADSYGIRGIPHLKLFVDGVEKEQMIGLQPFKTLKDKIFALRKAA